MRFAHAAVAALLGLCGAAAHAHPGHGAVHDWHWHASDSAGLVTVIVIATIALWLAREE